MNSKKNNKLSVYLASTLSEFDQSNSERLRALYSEFSKLSILNKYAYDTNIKYWKTVILDCNQQGYLGTQDYALGIDKSDIAEQFHRPGLGRPLTLDCVIEAMERDGSLMTLENFNKQYTTQSAWISWFYNSIVQNIFQWRWRALPDHVQQTSKLYIIMPTIKAVAKNILAQHFQSPVKNASHGCMTLNEFKEKYAHHFLHQLELSDNDIVCVLKYLQSQHGVAIADNVKGYATTYMLIKFPQRDTETAIITKHDEAVLSIRTTCHALSVQVDELQKKSEELEQESREAKSMGRIPKALYCLKRKKNLQDILKKRLQSMETMDTILMKMEASQDDKQVVEAFNLGADALRNLLGGEGLSLESVDNAMQNIQNALQDQKEVEDAIKMGNEEVSNISGYSDTDFEQELSELMEETQHHHPKAPLPPIQAQTQTQQQQQQQQQQHSPLPNQPSPGNSELARLNQMFSNIKSIPTDINSRSGRIKELA